MIGRQPRSPLFPSATLFGPRRARDAARTARNRRGLALPAKAPRRAPTRQAATAILSSPALLPNGFVAAHGRKAFADGRKGGPYSARAELFQDHGHRRGGPRTRVEVSLEPLCTHLHVPPLSSFLAPQAPQTPF